MIDYKGLSEFKVSGNTTILGTPYLEISHACGWFDPQPEGVSLHTIVLIAMTHLKEDKDAAKK